MSRWGIGKDRDREDATPPGAADLPDVATGTASGPPPGAGASVAEPQDHDVAAVLRVTSFRRLWLALGGSSFGDWLGLLATAAFATTLGGEDGSYAKANLAVAGVFILRLLPSVLLGPIAGAIADRLSRRWTMVISDLVRGVLFISIPIVGTLEWLYIATVLIECAALFFMPAKDATVPNLVPRNRLEAANQMSLATTYGTAPLAALVFAGISLLNGILDNFLERFQTNPVDFALYVNAATFIISALVIARLPIPETGRGVPREQQVGVWRSIVDGWTFIGTTPLVRGLVLGMLGAFAAAGFVIGLAPTYVTDLGAGQPGFGVLFGSVFLGLAAGMWMGPRLLGGFSRRRMFGLSLIAAGGFLAAIALIPNIVMAVLFAAALGACGGVAWVTGYTLLGLEVDDDVRGRTFAFLASMSRIVLVLVLALGPALAALVGRHTITFTEYRQLTYSGAAFVFLLAAILAVGFGVTAYRQMDDRAGTPLRNDLRDAWIARRDKPEQMARRAYPGLFVALEGGDGTGKSTQARLLADWLRADQGHEVVLTREPGATPVGVRLREVLLGHGPDLGDRAEALMFAADRAHHVVSLVRPALERGAVVVTDRYMDSSIAYQGAGRELDIDDVARLSRWATDGLVPDLTVLLDLHPKVTKARRAKDAARSGEDRLESLPDEFHGRVRAKFLELARREPHRYLVLDAGLGVDEIQQRIRQRVQDVLPVSAKRKQQLKERLVEEGQSRERRANAESEVLQMDANLRAKRIAEAKDREESKRRAREEAERQLQEEAERELRAQQAQEERQQAATVALPEGVAVPSGATPLGQEPPEQQTRPAPLEPGALPPPVGRTRLRPAAPVPPAPPAAPPPSPAAERAAAAAVRAGVPEEEPETRRPRFRIGRRDDPGSTDTRPIDLSRVPAAEDVPFDQEQDDPDATPPAGTSMTRRERRAQER